MRWSVLCVAPTGQINGSVGSSARGSGPDGTDDPTLQRDWYRNHLMTYTGATLTSARCGIIGHPVKLPVVVPCFRGYGHFRPATGPHDLRCVPMSSRSRVVITAQRTGGSATFFICLVTPVYWYARSKTARHRRKPPSRTSIW